MNESKTKLQKIIQGKIKNNTKFLDEINQFLHNNSIEFSKRYVIIIAILLNKGTHIIKNEIGDFIKNKLDKTSIDKNEIYQIIFMFFGNQYFKKKLDQYYSPMTICNFICDLLITGKSAIDPACGTGDLINHYNGNITLCDKCESVLEITKFISSHLGNDAIIINKDSLKELINVKTYDYCVMNPPFGAKTIITDKNILQEYHLGQKRKKQEIGILFVELGCRILKKDGILFAIVPNGYLGNKNSNYYDFRRFIIDNYRLLGIIKLPDNAFARSGTGVATSILIIQNKKIEGDYPIFIQEVKDIGYILNKKNTPLKYRINSEGYYIYDNQINPIIHNDLIQVKKLFYQFVYDNNISHVISADNNLHYEIVNRNDLGHDLIFDIKRYLDRYKTVIQKSIENNYKKIENYCVDDVCLKFKKTMPKYNYIDIKCVNSPLFKFNSYNTVSLPARAKYKVQKNDILISKLKGKISFTVITNDIDNLVVSNGFAVLRPKDHKSLVILFANLFSKSFRIQHQSLVTGSIMETLTDDDIKKCYINDAIDYDKYDSILRSITILNNELYTICD